MFNATTKLSCCYFVHIYGILFIIFMSIFCITFPLKYNLLECCCCCSYIFFFYNLFVLMISVCFSNDLRTTQWQQKKKNNTMYENNQNEVEAKLSY